MAPLREIAEKIDWDLVARIWSVNQPFIKMTSGSQKRRGNKKTVTEGQGEILDEEVAKRKECRGFRAVTFSMTHEFGDFKRGNIDQILFRCSGLLNFSRNFSGNFSGNFSRNFSRYFSGNFSGNFSRNCSRILF